MFAFLTGGQVRGCESDAATGSQQEVRPTEVEVCWTSGCHQHLLWLVVLWNIPKISDHRCIFLLSEWISTFTLCVCMCVGGRVHLCDSKHFCLTARPLKWCVKFFTNTSRSDCADWTSWQQLVSYLVFRDYIRGEGEFKEWNTVERDVKTNRC